MEENVQTTQNGVTEPTAEAPANTQPPAAPAEAAQVDIAKLEQIVQERLEKSGEKIFREMLEKKNLDTDTVNQMTAEWRSKQQTPEQAMQELQGKLSASETKYTALEQKFLAVGKGIPADKADDYIALANARMIDGVTFEDALSKALETFPINKPKNEVILPPSGPVDVPTKEVEYKTKLAEAREKKDNFAAIKIKQEAAREGIILN